MTRRIGAGDPFDVPDLPFLVRDALARGATPKTLAAASGGVVKHQRWGQLKRSQRLTEFPEPATLRAIAKALGISETAAVIATARAVGLDVHPRHSALGERVPVAADRLPMPVQRAVLNLIDALAAERVVESMPAAAQPADESEDSG